MTEVLRIAMWSGPRNISTAMMRAFGNRADTSVIDEPFYAAYLAATGLSHPMRDAVLASQSTDPGAVVRVLTGPVPGGRGVFYQKHMTHHMLPGIERSWMALCRNVFLIRSPPEVLSSYRTRHDQVALDDIGIKQQVELFDMVCDALGHAAPVIDAADVLADPKAVLCGLCAALGLEFTEAMLRWPAGGRPTDGAWAPAWYQSVEASTGWDAKPAEQAHDGALEPIAAAAWPFYEKLARHRMRGTTTGGPTV